jgi:hypothetical protein
MIVFGTDEYEEFLHLATTGRAENVIKLQKKQNAIMFFGRSLNAAWHNDTVNQRLVFLESFWLRSFDKRLQTVLSSGDDSTIHLACFKYSLIVARQVAARGRPNSSLDRLNNIELVATRSLAQRMTSELGAMTVRCSTLTTHIIATALRWLIDD